jgi:hypothetical protein
LVETLVGDKAFELLKKLIDDNVISWEDLNHDIRTQLTEYAYLKTRLNDWEQESFNFSPHRIDKNELAASLLASNRDLCLSLIEEFRANYLNRLDDNRDISVAGDTIQRNSRLDSKPLKLESSNDDNNLSIICSLAEQNQIIKVECGQFFVIKNGYLYQVEDEAVKTEIRKIVDELANHFRLPNLKNCLSSNNDIESNIQDTNSIAEVIMTGLEEKTVRCQSVPGSRGHIMRIHFDNTGAANLRCDYNSRTGSLTFTINDRYIDIAYTIPTTTELGRQLFDALKPIVQNSVNSSEADPRSYSYDTLRNLDLLYLGETKRILSYVTELHERLSHDIDARRYVQFDLSGNNDDFKLKIKDPTRSPEYQLILKDGLLTINDINGNLYSTNPLLLAWARDIKDRYSNLIATFKGEVITQQLFNALINMADPYQKINMATEVPHGCSPYVQMAEYYRFTDSNNKVQHVPTDFALYQKQLNSTPEINQYYKYSVDVQTREGTQLFAPDYLILKPGDTLSVTSPQSNQTQFLQIPDYLDRFNKSINTCQLLEERLVITLDELIAKKITFSCVELFDDDTRYSNTSVIDLTLETYPDEKGIKQHLLTISSGIDKVTINKNNEQTITNPTYFYIHFNLSADNEITNSMLYLITNSMLYLLENKTNDHLLATPLEANTQTKLKLLLKNAGYLND